MLKIPGFSTITSVKRPSEPPQFVTILRRVDKTSRIVAPELQRLLSSRKDRMAWICKVSHHKLLGKTLLSRNYQLTRQIHSNLCWPRLVSRINNINKCGSPPRTNIVHHFKRHSAKNRMSHRCWIRWFHLVSRSRRSLKLWSLMKVAIT